MGQRHDPIILRTPAGKQFGGVSRDLGAPVFNLAAGTETAKLEARRGLLQDLESPVSGTTQSHDHFRDMALDMLLNQQVRQAFDLDREPAKGSAPSTTPS